MDNFCKASAFTGKLSLSLVVVLSAGSFFTVSLITVEDGMAANILHYGVKVFPGQSFLSKRSDKGNKLNCKCASMAVEF